MDHSYWWPKDWQEAYELSIRYNQLSKDGTIQSALHREYLKRWGFFATMISIAALALLFLVFLLAEVTIQPAIAALILILAVPFTEWLAICFGEYAEDPNGEVRARVGEQLGIPLRIQDVMSLRMHYPKIAVYYFCCRSWFALDFQPAPRRAPE